MRYSFFIKLRNKATQRDIVTLLDMFSKHYTEEYYKDMLSFGSVLKCIKPITYQNSEFLNQNSVQPSGHVINFGKTIRFIPDECVILVDGEDWSIDDNLNTLVCVEDLKDDELALWKNIDIVPVPDDQTDYTNTLAFHFEEIMEETTKVLWGKDE